MAKYQASDIQILEGLDAVRMRPGMYIGSTGSRGLHHLIWEIVDNAIDEAMNGYASEITVTLKKDDSCEVTDNGRGIPVDIHPQLGVSAVEVVYTQLHAGGKFDNKNYAYSGGLHGVGASVVNALSEWLVVDVFQDFSHYQQRFESVEDQKNRQDHLRAACGAAGENRKHPKARHHRQLQARPPRVRETNFNGDQVRRRIRELAYLNQGVSFRFTDERIKDAEKRTVEYKYDGGIADFVKYLNADKNGIGDVILFEGKREGTMLRVAIQYTDSYTENIFSFVNNIPTGEGGTHETASRPPSPRCSTTTPGGWGAQGKGQQPVRRGLPRGHDRGHRLRRAEAAVRGADQGPPGQHRGSPHRGGHRHRAAGTLSGGLEASGPGPEDHRKGGAGRPRAGSRPQGAGRGAPEKPAGGRAAGGQAVQLHRSGRLEERAFHRGGDSAGGSAKQGRDRRFQAILPLRGKPLNVEKKRIDQVLANEEFRSVITALGTGIGEDFDLNSLKYNA